MASTEESILPSTVGFIGLGLMGKPMVVNLAKKLPQASRIYAHDVVRTAVDELHEQFGDRVSPCQTAREVTSLSDVVITMLPEGAHVKSVYLDPASGIIAALNDAGLSPSPEDPTTKPKLLVDSSTIDTATHLAVKSALANTPNPPSFYDAPVSGGVLGAEAGTMAFFLGCSPTDPALAPLTALLSLMGARAIPCGGPSLGLAAKLSNNYLSGIITIAVAEAMDMGMRAGLAPPVLARVFGAGTAQNAICDGFNPVPGVCPAAPSSRGYRGGFRVELMRKDVGLAVGLARAVGAGNVLGVAGLGVYAAASEATDCRGLDSRVVFRYLGGREDWRKTAEAEGEGEGQGVE